MKKHIIIKSIALLFSWLIFSPLLLILDVRWKLLPKWLRIVLFVVSPMMLICIILAMSFADKEAEDHFHRYHFIKPKVIERITGVRFPEYHVVDYNNGCFVIASIITIQIWNLKTSQMRRFIKPWKNKVPIILMKLIL